MSDHNKSPVHFDALLETQNETLCQRGLTLETAERLAGIVDAAMDAIVGLDSDLLVETFNGAAEQMFGVSAAEMIGQPLDRLIPAEHRDLHRLYMQFFHKTGVTNHKMNSLGVLRGVRADGTEFPIEVSISSVNVTGTEIMTAIVRDISERLRAEEEMRARNASLEQRLAERTAELATALEALRRSQDELTRSESKAMPNTLAACVSHELLTPISNGVLATNTLTGLVCSFRKMLDCGSLKRSDFIAKLDDAESCCALVERNLTRAEELLSSFRQVAADQASEQLRTFDLAATINDVITTLGPTLKRHPHRVVVNIPVGIVIHSKPGPLGQVAINLINNAYLHAFESRKNGVLTIDAHAADDWVNVHFIDNGVGIPAEHLEKLYDAFFSTKIGKGGTGLGMAIVKNLVTKVLGGEIAVQSALGLGTRFDIRLPRRLAPGDGASVH